MNQASLQAMLKAGIQALRRGDRAAGRDLLLQVVAADEHCEPAWLWLSQALDNPADRLVALENVLALNPAHEGARAEAQALRLQLNPGVPAAAPTPALPPAAPEPAPPPALPDASALDHDPDQCLYCGQVTEPEATHCPYCGRSLLKEGHWEGNSPYRLLVILAALLLQFTVLQPSLTLAALGLLKSPGDLQTIMLGPALGVMVGRIFLWAIGFFVVLSSQSLAAHVAAGVTVLDLAIIGLSRYLGWLPSTWALVNAITDVVLLAQATLMLVSRSQARVRHYLVLDRDAYSHVEFYRRGRRYALRGQWALAALHFQKAMVLRPTVAAYYKDLSTAQIKLGRYTQALRTVRQGAEMIPADPDFPALTAALERQRRE